MKRKLYSERRDGECGAYFKLSDRKAITGMARIDLNHIDSIFNSSSKSEQSLKLAVSIKAGLYRRSIMYVLLF